jgi:uncharacterized protein (DUF302 family)
MAMQSSNYGMSVEVALGYDEAVEKAREELSKEGFGVLTEIDVKATMKKKLDVEFRPYIILGACNPPLAHQALSAESDIGLLLPCNVIVYASDDPGRCVVAAIDPVAQLELSGNRDIGPIAEQVKQRLQRVLEGVAA